MSIPTDEVNAWHQMTMEAPPVIEFTLKVGMMRAEQHGQVQLEIRDATADKLLALTSRPHLALESLPIEAMQMLRKLVEALNEYSGPFPPS